MSNHTNILKPIKLMYKKRGWQHQNNKQTIEEPIKMHLFETLISDESIDLVTKTLKSGFINQGPRVKEFEERLQKELWFTNPLTLNSCTAALHLALTASGVKAGDEVILPAQTFIATGLAVLMCGAIPIFCDADFNGNLSYTHLDQAVTPKTKAVIVVHWGGIPADLENIAAVCRKHNLKLIEDAAHALGAHYDKSPIGSCKYSDFCCFSLQAIKRLTTGDGGIICCKSKDDYNRIKKLRWFGVDKDHIVRDQLGTRVMNAEELGYKYHMNDIAASIGLGNLNHVKGWINQSNSNAMLIYNRLKDINQINFPIIAKNVEPAYWFYTILVHERNELLQFLISNNIPASLVDTRIDNLPVFKQYRQFLYNTETYNMRSLALPCHPKITIDDINFMTSKIREFYEIKS